MSKALLDRLDWSLAIARPDFHAELRQGVTDAELDVFEKRFGVRLPELFRALYRWRDGQEETSEESFVSLVDIWVWMSIEWISREKEMLDGMIGYDFEDPAWWRSGWVPFLSNGAGDYVCLDLNPEDRGNPGQVIRFYHDWESRPRQFESFEDALRYLLSAIELGPQEI